MKNGPIHIALGRTTTLSPRTADADLLEAASCMDERASGSELAVRRDEAGGVCFVNDIADETRRSVARLASGDTEYDNGNETDHDRSACLRH